MRFSLNVHWHTLHSRESAGSCNADCELCSISSASSVVEKDLEELSYGEHDRKDTGTAKERMFGRCSLK